MSEPAVVADAAGFAPSAPVSASSSTSLKKCIECELEANVFCTNCKRLFCSNDFAKVHDFNSNRDHKRIAIKEYLLLLRGRGTASPADVDILVDAENRLCFFNPYNDRITMTPRLGTLFRDHPNARPSLVSLIGPTGVGKSTLIRFLISLGDSSTELSLPIPGAPKATQSTSADIHMYDGGVLPNSYLRKAGVNSTIPLAFVDSEGLHGSREPLSIDNLFNSIRKVLSDGTYNRDYGEYLKRRSRHVAKSYPRLLYMFSDVVCFVFSGDWRERQSILKPLLEWNQNAAWGAANQICPQLIIIINKDVEGAEAEEYDDFRKTYKMWIEGDESRSDLELFFTDPQVVLIPNLDLNTLVAIERLKRLRDTIFRSVIRIRKKRESFHQLFTHRELQLCMDLAANTFSKDPSAEFDIYKAAVAWKSISVGVGAFASFREEVEGACSSKFPKYFSHALSLTILRDRVRWAVLLDIGRLGVSVAFGQEATLPPDLRTALEQAQSEMDKEMPCGATKEGDGKTYFCDTVRRVHVSNSGTPTEKSFHSSAGPGIDSVPFRWEGCFEPPTDVEVAANSCRLVPLAEHALRTATTLNVEEIRRRLSEVRKGELQKHEWFKSPSFYRACVCCMLQLPTEVLSCGHIICSLCAKEEVKMGALSQSMDICCPVCFSEAKFHPNYLPSSAGYRILSLDGGGVRGIIELLSLQKLMSYFDGMQVEELFDVVVGTSAGGIIALALTVRAVNEQPKRVPEVIALFEDFSKNVFSVGKIKSVLNRFGVTDILQFLGGQISKYNNDTLDEQLKKYLGTDLMVRSCVSGPRVIVTSCLSNQDYAGAWFTSYIRAGGNTGSDRLSAVVHLKKGEADTKRVACGRVEDSHIFSVKDVATATSAATTYFPVHTAHNRSWVDGGLRFNCPAAIALQEGRAIWPGQSVSAFISLGSGRLPVQKNWFAQLIFDLVNILTDSESQYKNAADMLVEFYPRSKDCRVRLNPEINEACNLDEVAKMQMLKEETEKYLGTPEGKSVVENAANILFSALFYLELKDSKFRIRSRAALPKSLQNALTDSPFTVEIPTAQSAEISWENCTWEQGIMNLPLSVSGFPLQHKQEVHVKLNTWLPRTRKPEVWPLPISGSPLTIQ